MPETRFKDLELCNEFIIDLITLRLTLKDAEDLKIKRTRAREN